MNYLLYTHVIIWAIANKKKYAKPEKTSSETQPKIKI